MGFQFSTEQYREAQRFNVWQEAVCDVFVKLDCEQLSDRAFVGAISAHEFGAARLSQVRSRDHQVRRTGDRIRRGREEDVLIQLQVSGTGLVVQDGRETLLQPGDLACYDSVRPYVLQFADDFEALVLHLPRDNLVKRVGQLEHLTARAVSGRSPLGKMTAQLIGQIQDAAGEVSTVTSERVCAITLDLVAAALREMSDQDVEPKSWSRTTLIYRAKGLIQENLDDHTLNTDGVARMLGISPRYLQDLFHAEGATVSDFIWARRLEQCRRELADPKLTAKYISQIALDGGFSNFGHFSRRFKAAFGLTPQDYRLSQMSPVSRILA